MKDVTIRKCRKKDLPSVIRVENESFEHPYKEEIFQMFLGHDKFLVAEQEGEVRGYILSDNRKDYGIILSIAVLPKYRGRGIGKKLMKKTFTLIDEDTVKLTLREKNLSAFRFYKQLGFKLVGIIDGYYKNDDDAILMKKDIKKYS